MIGAGDIKLLAVLGAFLGAEKSLWCLFWSFALASVFALGVMLARGTMRERFSYLAAYTGRFLQTRRREPYRQTECAGREGQQQAPAKAGEQQTERAATAGGGRHVNRVTGSRRQTGKIREPAGWDSGANIHFAVPVLMAVLMMTGGTI